MNLRFESLKAIESLRLGVPNRHAVATLGQRQGTIEREFDHRALFVQTISAGDTRSASGFIIEGGYGSGKSHTLRYLESISKKAGFTTGVVTVSKETPLGDLDAVFRASVATLSFPNGMIGGSLGMLLERFDTRSPAWSALKKTLLDPSNVYPNIFAASLILFERYRADLEFIEKLVDFWDGGMPEVVLWRRMLKEAQDGVGRLLPVKKLELAPHRFRFAAAVIKAAAFKGWLLCVDEMELLAKFPLRSRAQAYASISELFTAFQGNANGLIAVGAVTDDLVGVIKDRRDRMEIRLRYGTHSGLMERAGAGISFLETARNRLLLKEPTIDDLVSAYEAIASLYSLGYDCELSRENRPKSADTSKSMRKHVREWITFWDLKRHDASYQPIIRTFDLRQALDEDEDLDRPPEGQVDE